MKQLPERPLPKSKYIKISALKLVLQVRGFLANPPSNCTLLQTGKSGKNTNYRTKDTYIKLAMLFILPIIAPPTKTFESQLTA